MTNYELVPVQGCPGCSTAGGVLSCPIHSPNVQTKDEAIQRQEDIKEVIRLEYIPGAYPKDLGYVVNELVDTVNKLIAEIKRLKESRGDAK